MKKSLNDLKQEVEEFGSSRGWANDDPNQLITSIMIELSELAEHYQWKDHFEEYSSEKKLEIGYEFVDVLVYLLRLASKSKIDLDEAFDSKLKKLAIKYPLGIGEDYQKQHELYRKTGKNKRYE